MLLVLGSFGRLQYVIYYLMYTICFVGSAYITVMAQKRVGKFNYDGTLYDILHFSNSFAPYYFINDYILKVYVILGLIYFSWIQIFQLIFLYSILTLIRSLSFSITILPHCQPIQLPNKNYNQTVTKI